jgi:hypothetical protein
MCMCVDMCMCIHVCVVQRPTECVCDDVCCVFVLVGV